MKRLAISAMIAMALGTAAVNASASINSQDFTSDVTRTESQTPGAWYVDRFAPSGFEGGVLFDGDERLKHSIAAADGSDNRSPSFSSGFYDTQGRKYDIAGATGMSIDLYVPAAWATTGRRMAGFWGTAFDAGASVSGYPIIEFTSTDNDPRFRWYSQDTDQDDQNGLSPGWIDMGLPTGFVYDAWYTLNIELSGGAWVGTIGDLTINDVATLGSAEIGNVILQGHNTSTGVDYDIYWDNFKAIPEPASLALLGIGGLAVLRRRR